MNGNPSDDNSNQTKYATWSGTGPDKWASVWFINTYLIDDKRVKIFPEGFEDPSYTYFDIPSSPLNRTAAKTSLEVLIDHFNVSDPDALFVAKIVHDIDINLWQAKDLPISTTVENGFRDLQKRYGRERVHPDCYQAFFDNVASLSSKKTTALEPIKPSKLLPPENCNTVAIDSVMAAELPVPELPIDQLLSVIARDKKILFIDVREQDEYLEGHLPGAINFTLRDLNEQSVASLPLDGVDYIIPYCVKDFRGYEMARKLQRLGVKNVALLKPYGLKGWLHEKLPLVKGNQPNSPEAQAELKKCMLGEKGCVRYL